MKKKLGISSIVALAFVLSGCPDPSGPKAPDDDNDQTGPRIEWIGEYHWFINDSHGVWDLCGNGSRLYAAFSPTYGTAEALDLGDPSVPEAVAEIPVGYYPGRYHLSGTYLYRIDDALSSAPGTPKLTTRNTSLPDVPLTNSQDRTGVDLCAAGGCLYVANTYGNSFSIFSLADPAVPAWIKDVTLAKSIKALAASGTTLYLADADTFRVYDISAPQTPVQAGSVALALPQSRLRVSGNYVYALTYTEIRTIDVRDPEHPLIVASPPAGNAPEDMFVLGDFLYVANNESGGGLIIDDISDPLDPVKVLSFTIDLAHTVYASGDYVYLGVYSSTGVASVPAGIKILQFTKP